MLTLAELPRKARPVVANLDAETTTHPEAFQESLQHLLPDLSGYSEITVHLLQQLVLACGEVNP